ncbi:hypothetical protein B4U79_18148 [Dinothrombium tinctorium]|uniref:RING-type domain-containing protein n=1 Tax=Dinothrombium tinctorium TaxID=1965070 RepID=A0A3S3P645_9ACAR|nr:hypothetical protein B4U79_18148 [Dinothrombium tinctorium]
MDSELCEVCFIDTANAKLDGCWHKFCAGCTIEWSRAEACRNGFTCPKCRQPSTFFVNEAGKRIKLRRNRRRRRRRWMSTTPVRPEVLRRTTAEDRILRGMRSEYRAIVREIDAIMELQLNVDKLMPRSGVQGVLTELRTSAQRRQVNV